MRIAVTGLGVVSPIGVGEEAFFASLVEGRSAIGEDAEGRKWDAPLAARVGDFGAKQAISAGALRRMPRLSQMTVVAAKQALPANLPYDPSRMGTVVGTGLGTLGETLDFVLGYLGQGPEAASPATFPISVMNAPAGQLAVELKVRGVNSTVNHRDHSALSALGMACDQLALGRADLILVAGIDELSLPVQHSYARLGGVSRSGLRPYDAARDGLIPGEAATVLCLEREEDAQKRGARIRAFVAGRGERGETRPRVGWGDAPSWPEAAEAVRLAVADAGGPRIGWVAGSGNGTTLDERELAAVQAGLGGALPPTSSILGQTGESLSSAMLRVLAGVLALERQWIPGTVGMRQPLASFADRLVATGRPAGDLLGGARLEHVLVPSFAQGGADLAVVLAGA